MRNIPDEGYNLTWNKLRTVGSLNGGQSHDSSKGGRKKKSQGKSWHLLTWYRGPLQYQHPLPCHKLIALHRLIQLAVLKSFSIILCDFQRNQQYFLVLCSLPFMSFPFSFVVLRFTECFLREDLQIFHTVFGMQRNICLVKPHTTCIQKVFVLTVKEW